MKRGISLILLVSMLLFVMVSCGESGADGEPASKTTDGENAADTETAEETSAEPDFPELTFNGEDVHFLTEESGANQYTSIEIYAESMDGTLINDTVFQRNSIIEDRFDVHIAQTRVNDAATVASNTIMAGDKTYDVVMPYLNNSVRNAVAGQYQNLLNIQYLNLDNPWWDARANENLQVGGKLYFTTGDISILDNDCTMVIFFNKELINDFSFENPYDLVKSGAWTIDKMFEMAYAVTADLNGDGKLTMADDRWGLYCAGNVPHSLFFASGERIVNTGAEGGLELVMNNPRSVDVVDKILNYCISDQNLTGDFYESAKAFSNKRILFAGWALVDIAFIRESEYDFGILPYPKYDEAQTEYYNLISTGLVPGVSIPITNDSTDKAGLILEAMAYYSVDTLTKSYYDIALNNRYVRDRDSSDMLDIIFSTRVYDLGYIFNIGSLGTMIETMYNAKNTNFVSTYERMQKAANKKLDEIVTAFTQAGN